MARNQKANVTGAKTLVEERPYVHVVDKSKLDRYCAYCLKDRNNERIRRCVNCHMAIYCNEDCREKAIKDHAKECEYSKRLEPFVPNNITRLMLRVIYKLQNNDFGNRADTWNYRSFRDIDHYVETILKKRELLELFMVSYQEITELVEVRIEKLEALKIFGKVWTSMVAISSFKEPVIAHGIYLGCCSLPHSCEPDAWRVFEGSTLILRTTKQDLKLTNAVTVSYILPIFPLHERRSFLNNVHFGKCVCKRCTDPYWEKLMHSARCSRCGEEALISPETRTTTAECQNKMCNLKFDGRHAIALMQDIERQRIRIGQPLNGAQQRWIMQVEGMITYVLSDMNVLGFHVLHHARHLYSQIGKAPQAVNLSHFMLPFAKLVSNGNEPFLTQFAHAMYKSSLNNKNFQERQIIARQLLGQVRKSHGEKHSATKTIEKEIEDNKICEPIRRRMGMLY